MNCWFVPFAIEAFSGAMEIEVSTGGVTVNVAAPLIVPEAALIVVDPATTLLATPALLTFATATAEEVQATVVVRFCVVLLLYVPVAVNCCV